MYKRLRSATMLIVCIEWLATGATNFETINGFEPHFVCPPNSVFKNIKSDYGAKGDGTTDDTKAFKNWLASGHRKIYIPQGTYILKEQLQLKDGMKRTMIMGERRSTSVLRLDDNSAGFNNPLTPKAFIHTRAPNQQGEQNMHNYIYHITVEIGRGNAGAVGINFHTNNSGAMKDVAIKAVDPDNARPLRGLAFDDYWFGPGSGRYLEIEGFKTGIYVGSAQNHTTLEHVSIKKCDIGLEIKQNAASVRALTTQSCQKGVQNGGHLVLVESKLLDGTDGGTAVGNSGKLLVHNLQTSGYTSAIASSSGSTAAGPTVAHYVSGPVAYNWQPAAGMDRTLGLPVKESPEYQYPQSSGEWAVVGSAGDVSRGIQDAIDKGAKTVYVEGGTMNSTVHLRGAVQRIMGLGTTTIIYATGSQPAFVLDDGTPQTVIVELCYANYGSTAQFACEQNSNRSLVFRHGSGGYRSLTNAKNGMIFIESVVGYPFHFSYVKAYVRDINTEQGGNNMQNIVNKGGVVWILGQKTEDYATKLATTDGGFTELLGGTYRQNWDAEDNVNSLIEGNPLFVVTNSSASFSFAMFTTHSGAPNYKYLIRETRNGVTKNLIHKAHGGTVDGVLPLAVAYAELPATGNMYIAPLSARKQPLGTTIHIAAFQRRQVPGFVALRLDGRLCIHAETARPQLFVYPFGLQ